MIPNYNYMISKNSSDKLIPVLSRVQKDSGKIGYNTAHAIGDVAGASIGESVGIWGFAILGAQTGFVAGPFGIIIFGTVGGIIGTYVGSEVGTSVVDNIYDK